MHTNQDSLRLLEDRDAIDEFYECMTACSLGDEDMECLTECIQVHLKEEDEQ